MPVIKCSNGITRFTKVDKNGRLRSYVKFICNKCNIESIQRSDEYKRRGSLCKSCKIKIHSQNELKNKDLELSLIHI